MMHHTAFHTSLPRRDESCVVFASPHSGSNYPADLMAKTVLSDHMVRSSEDAFVDHGSAMEMTIVEIEAMR